MPGMKKPLRQNVAIAVDGGGIKGVMVARALMRVEEAVGEPVYAFTRLTAGTSTGAIIAAAIARGLDAQTMHQLYVDLGPKIFRKTWRNLPLIELLVRYQYDSQPLIDALDAAIGPVTLGDLHRVRPDFHMVITATDIYANQTRFIKLYKERYHNWLLRDAVMASSIVPTMFPVYPHRYATEEHPAPPDEAWIPEPRYWVDGGVGSYSNPCYMAAYEVAFCLQQKGWRLDNTTLISIGTGRAPLDEVWSKRLRDFKRTPADLFGPEWAFPTVDTFVHDANRQQVRLTKHFFVDAVARRTGSIDNALDFRRFNIDFDETIMMDDTDSISKLSEYGVQLGNMIISNEQDDVGHFACGAAPHAFSMDANGNPGQIV